MAKLDAMPNLPVRGARRTRGMRVSTQLAEINVVPLVDVMLVLLVIFMVAAPMMQQGFGVNLPQARKASPIESTPVTVSVPINFARDHKLLINDDMVPFDVLGERIKQALQGQLDRQVILQTDGQVTMQDTVTVMSALTAAGIEKVSIATQPVSAKAGR
jgi:biopolymer transport protein TolR